MTWLTPIIDCAGRLTAIGADAEAVAVAPPIPEMTPKLVIEPVLKNIPTLSALAVPVTVAPCTTVVFRLLPLPKPLLGLLAVPVQVAVTLSPAAGVHWACARSLAATDAIKRASIMACRRMARPGLASQVPAQTPVFLPALARGDLLILKSPPND
jgi:hypothetical protein